MERIYKISFHIYRIILISIFPLFIFAKFMVGSAGHNSDTEITDYLLIAFVIITPTLLTILNKNKDDENNFKNILRFIIGGLILISLVFLSYGLHDSWLLYKDQNFGISDNIPVVIITLLITLSSVILVGLIKNKF